MLTKWTNQFNRIFESNVTKKQCLALTLGYAALLAFCIWLLMITGPEFLPGT